MEKALPELQNGQAEIWQRERIILCTEKLACGNQALFNLHYATES